MANPDKLWHRYHEGRQPQALQALVLHYLPLVKIICGKFYSTSDDFDDLLQEGAIGLIQAVEAFDPSRNVKFETYASLRIRGSVLDYLRKRRPGGRQVQEKIRQLDRAVQELSARLGRFPDDKEIQQALNLTTEKYQQFLQEAQPFVVALGPDQSVEDLPQEGDDAANPEEVIDHLDLKEQLAKALGSLSQKERDVVALYYYEDMTMKEIAEATGLSESRISQVHSRVLLKLRYFLAERGKM